MAEEACQSRKVSKAKGRFTHLLEPIRSLADNWSVDIACELEAYLEELEDLCCAEEEEVTQSTEGPADGGDDVVMEKKKFSFAKAALLVQGSTYVYSKKVRVQLETTHGSREKIHHVLPQGTALQHRGLRQEHEGRRRRRIRLDCCLLGRRLRSHHPRQRGLQGGLVFTFFTSVWTDDERCILHDSSTIKPFLSLLFVFVTERWSTFTRWSWSASRGC